MNVQDTTDPEFRAVIQKMALAIHKRAEELGVSIEVATDEYLSRFTAALAEEARPCSK